jgi:hypothetical protein
MLTKINKIVNTPPPARNPRPAKAPQHLSSLPDTFQRGFLGKSASLVAQLLAQLGWHNFIKLLQQPTSLSPTIHSLAHPAAPYLSRIAWHGVPLLSSTPPWDPTLKTTAFRCGPHPSASRQYADFLLLDMYDYVRMGFWVVLPFSAIRNHPYLKLAPAGVVPQCDRCPRPIMDYTYNNVSQTSLPIVPFSSMQFGSALQCILQRLAYCNPAYGPPLMAKLDLADGYYRIPLTPNAAIQLAVILPPDDTGEPLIGIPLTLPMGFVTQPAIFLCIHRNHNGHNQSHHRPHTKFAAQSSTAAAHAQNTTTTSAVRFHRCTPVAGQPSYGTPSVCRHLH